MCVGPSGGRGMRLKRGEQARFGNREMQMGSNLLLRVLSVLSQILHQDEKISMDGFPYAVPGEILITPSRARLSPSLYPIPEILPSSGIRGILSVGVKS